MSGSFLNMDVPPTLVSFAIAPADAEQVVSPEFKKSGDPVYLFTAPKGDYAGTLAMWERFHELVKAGKVQSRMGRDLRRRGRGSYEDVLR